MSKSSPQFSSKNQLLAALPKDEYERLLPNLEPVRLPKGEVIYEAGDTVGYTYFLRTGIVSFLCATGDGATIEIGLVGNEGIVGIPVILRVNRAAYRSIVLMPVDALRIKAEALKREFNRGGQLQDLLLRYTHAALTQIAQSVLCNRFHKSDKRLARWLLTAHDRVRSETVNLTQECLAHLLGTSRTNVSMVANPLQDAGLIRYKRGRITVLDRKGLEAASCECYRIIKDEITLFLAA